MKPIRIVLCLLLALSASLASADNYAWHAAAVTGGEKAVLVLCPGMNQDGAFFLDESPWMDFAKDNDLGVIAIAFRSNAEGLSDDRRQGYYWPEQGSGAALLAAIDETYGEDLPILMYGFSGGAHFTSRFAEWKPARVVAWAAYSAQFWDSPHPGETNPPGIVACGEYDGARWHPSFSYFYEGRQQGKPWVWVSLSETGHYRHGAFEQFVRDFFEGVRNVAEPAAFADVESGELFESSGDSIQAELLAIFPNDTLRKAWRKVHAF